jgi:hypothetical protein
MKMNVKQIEEYLDIILAEIDGVNELDYCKYIKRIHQYIETHKNKVSITSIQDIADYYNISPAKLYNICNKYDLLNKNMGVWMWMNIRRKNNQYGKEFCVFDEKIKELMKHCFNQIGA